MLSFNIHGNLAVNLHNVEFLNVIQNYDIIFLSECWLNSKDKVHLDNYTCFKKVRKRKKKSEEG